MDVKGKHITVLGAARSGIAAARMLKKHGASVFVSDMADPGEKKEETLLLERENIPHEFGRHSGRVFQSDVIILSPGIPFASNVVQAAARKRIPVYSEVEAAYWFNRSPLIGVTGSNGKTTTTTLIGAMLRKRDPQAIVAGNIGSAFSDHVGQSVAKRWAVVELSSFQLETIDSFKPDMAVVLNFSPNHLNRYSSYEAYQQAKWRITMNMTEKELIIYNADDPLLSGRVEAHKARKQGFSLKKESDAHWREGTLFLHGRKLMEDRDMALAGLHNYMNALAASLAADEAGVERQDMVEVLSDFGGLEHRLEKVRELEGVLYVNDSKATTLESLYWALQSFKRPVVLIAGGQDKGSTFTRLNDLIKKHVRAAVLIGTAAEKMAASWKGLAPMLRAATMEEAVEKARATAQKGDVVLLSPACASFDMFRDYEQRGEIFKHIVNGL